MCKICQRVVTFEGEIQWGSSSPSGLWAKRSSAKATSSRLNALSLKTPESELTVEDANVNGTPEVFEEESNSSISDGDDGAFSGIAANLKGNSAQDPADYSHESSRKTSPCVDSSTKEEDFDPKGKLENSASKGPATRSSKALFYLPGDSEDEDAVKSFQDPSSSELLKNSDLYPVPKTSAYSPPGAGTPSANLVKASSPTYSDGGENIKDTIKRCLARARTRSTSLSGVGSFGAGLYRLEALVSEDKEDPFEPSPSLAHKRQLSLGKPGTKDAGSDALMPHSKEVSTITDVCANEDVDEVEIISLVQEQIPRYKLRADRLTELSGYDNEGWCVPFPALKESEVEALSPEQAEGALAYFVLCGSRVNQMTRTYHDIEAVTRLLQEKEKDLELAARIGQQLLARNRGLDERTSSLENEILTLNEQLTQVRHDLQMKTELLQIYTNDVDESSTENTPTGNRPINIDFLQRRVVNLEDENKTLRQEATQLAFDTQDCENREKELVHDVIKQLNDANLQVNQLGDELAKKVEDSLRQQEEITQLLAQVVDLQSGNKRLNFENEELRAMVGVSRECQQELTTELAGLKEKYAEVLDLLHDTQEQLRRAQKKHLPGSRGSHLGSFFSSPFDSGNDSIASELHSLTSSLSDGERADGAKALNRVFDTVRLSSRLSGSTSGMGSLQSTPTKQANLTAPFMSGPYQMTDSRSFGGYSPFYCSASSSHMSGMSGLPSLDSGADSDASFHTDSEDNYPASRPGVPGWPGTPDLDKCLRRLGPSERQGFLPYGCRTPDSIMSTGSGRSGPGYAGSDWKLPQKLQIVKPIEGSLTLHQWRNLATPHLGGLLDEREGVAIKGAANSDLNLEVYSMSDLEEDDPEDAKSEFPGKQFMSTSGVNTYTNSTILHPDDVTNLTSTLQHAQSSVLPSSNAAASATPVHGASLPPSRRGSTATFSTNVGLAKHLNERGFVSTLNDLLPTATPANSPEGSRPGSPEPSRYKLPGFEDLTKTFHSGASFLRRTFYKDEPSVPSSPEGPKINLVAKVQAIGVDRFVGVGGSIKTVGGVVTSRPESSSPLLHLSNLIRSGAGKKPPLETPATTTAAASPGATTPNDSPSVAPGGIMSAPKISSPGERRPKIPSGAPMGIPGRPGSTQLDSRLKQLKPGQRADLGTVGKIESRPRPSNLGQVPGRRPDEKMGTIGWTSFGRKGGLL